MSVDARIGSRVAGYRVDELIGRGGMGVVYRAEHLHLGRTVALKLLAPELSANEDFRERFVRESRTAAEIAHPNIVTIYDAGEVDGVLYIAMQYVEGSDLRTLLARERVLDPGQALWIVGQVADALDAAHARGLVHRDVKPGNVLLDDRRAYLADFGLTKRTMQDTPFTAPGRFLGTIAYMAPEQIQGGRLDGRTDVYSLGCLLFRCLTGAAPFERETDVAALYAHLEEPPPRLTERRPDLPAALDPVLARAMAKRREDRFDTCAACVRAAREALGEQEQSVASGERTTPVAWPGPTPRPLPDDMTREGSPPAGAGGATRVGSPGTATPASAVGGRSHRRGRGALFAAVGLLVLAGVAAAVVALTGDDPPVDGPGGREPDLTAPAPSAPPPAEKRTIDVGSRPVGLAIGPGGVFVSASGDGAMRRLELLTGRPLGPPIATGGSPSYVTIAAGSVWVAQPSLDALTRIDARTGVLDGQPIPVGDEPSGVAAGDGFVWVANAGDGSVTRVHQRTGVVTGAPTRVGRGPKGVATSRGVVWVADTSDGTVTRLSSRTGRVLGDPVRVGRRPQGMTVLGRTLWIANRRDDTVSRIDIATGRVLPGRIRVGDQPLGMAAGAGYVWVANAGDGTVTRIDPESARVAGRPIRVGRRPTAIRIGAGAVWVTNFGSDTVTRIEP